MFYGIHNVKKFLDKNEFYTIIVFALAAESFVLQGLS